MVGDLLRIGAMEKMPYQDQPQVDRASIPFAWHFGLPTIRGEKATLREVHAGDAPALLAMLTSEEVAEFVSPLPRTVEGFEGFIAEARHDRIRGNSFCFGVVPRGTRTRWGYSGAPDSSPDSAAPNGGLRSARRSGAGEFSGGREGRHRLFVRGRRHAAARSAIDRVERPRQCSAAKSRCVAGKHASPFVSAERAVLRPDPLVDRQGRLAADEAGMGPDDCTDFRRGRDFVPTPARPSRLPHTIKSDERFRFRVRSAGGAHRAGSRRPSAARRSCSSCHRGTGRRAKARARGPARTEFLRRGDLLVVNDTKVFPARLLGPACRAGAPSSACC